MFTENYIKYRQLMFRGSSAVMTMYTGDTFTAASSKNSGNDIGANIRYARCGDPGSSGVYFGTGTKAPQKTDYNLESVITSGLSITNPSSATHTTPGDGEYECMAAYTVTNTSGSPITISEVGYFSALAPTTNGYYATLFERTVLSSPITIPAGETRTITYKIAFKQSQ